MKILIVDDQELIVDKIAGLIEEKYPSFEVRKALNSAQVTKILETESNFDLAFIDIQLDDESGIDTANFISGKIPDIKMVFISGYPDMVSDVFFSVRPFGFIDKPIKKEKLYKYIDTTAGYDGGANKSFQCKIRGKEIRIPYNDILYMESGNKNLIIHKTDGILKAAGALEDAEKVLPETFVRCHKSYIVNLKYVTAYSKMTLTIMGGDSVGVSRSRKELFENKYLSYKRLQ